MLEPQAKYWYCCGSVDPAHSDERARKCVGAPAYFRHFATLEEHGARDKARSFGDVDRDKRIHALELQVHTLTAAVQHLMQITKPLIELAQQAQAQSGIILER